MMLSIKNLLATAALVSLAHAETITVTARDDNSFDPDQIRASQGDIVEFKFERGNHSVVSGDYRVPCSPLQLQSVGSFFSGFIETNDDMADEVFRININTADPIVFYSSVDRQCPDGMAGIINANYQMSLDDYRDRAASLSSGVSPGREPSGGELSGSSDDDFNEHSTNYSGYDEDAAGAFKVPVISLLAAVGAAFFMA